MTAHAFAVACNGGGTVALAIDVSSSFLAAAGGTVALFHGTAYVTRDPIGEVAARARAPRLARRGGRPAGSRW
jgi:hydrogenase/urease accessory protein HupE